MAVEALVVAAGSGSRMMSGEKKQYLKVGGVPILARTLLTFSSLEAIDGITLVVAKDDAGMVREKIIQGYGIKKVTRIVPGGESRQESVFNGLKSMGESAGPDDIILIHDGVRPFVRRESILEVIEAVRMYGAAVLAVPCKDTVKEADGHGFFSKTLRRDMVWQAQTPQGFRFGLILKAHELAVEEAFTGTDDSSLVERLGERVRIVRGDYDNIKITTPEDMAVASQIAKRFSQEDGL